MTYEHDFERNKLTGAGLGDYQNSPDVGSGAGKWLLLALIAIILALGAAALFSSDPQVTATDNPVAEEQNVAPLSAPVTESE